jgi:RES domain-containing protein
VITAWRIVEAQYADEIFSGEGARLFAARWHEAGHRLVYAAATLSLATLELIVNTPRARLLRDYVVTSCTFPEAIVDDVDESRLPANWRAFPPPVEVQQLGMDWLLGGSSAVLSVPSAVIPNERNYLLNPEHEYFRSVDVGAATPFQLDFRLLT